MDRLIEELEKYNMEIVALPEISWQGMGGYIEVSSPFRAQKTKIGRDKGE